MTGRLDAKKVAKYYTNGLWTAEMVQSAIAKGVITQAEHDKIVQMPVNVRTNN